MSRIGKLPIPVPDGVQVALETGNRLSVTGSRGTLQRTFAPSMLINVETGTITVDRDNLENSSVEATMEKQATAAMGG